MQALGFELSKAFDGPFECSPRNTSKCYFGKFLIKQSGLAVFDGIVSKPGEKNPCKWSGLPGAGGVVCESLGFDYRKAKLPLARVGRTRLQCAECLPASSQSS